MSHAVRGSTTFVSSDNQHFDGKAKGDDRVAEMAKHVKPKPQVQQS